MIRCTVVVDNGLKITLCPGSFRQKDGPVYGATAVGACPGGCSFCPPAGRNVFGRHPLPPTTPWPSPFRSVFRISACHNTVYGYDDLTRNALSHERGRRHGIACYLTYGARWGSVAKDIFEIAGPDDNGVAEETGLPRSAAPDGVLPGAAVDATPFVISRTLPVRHFSPMTTLPAIRQSGGVPGTEFRVGGLDESVLMARSGLRGTRSPTPTTTVRRVDPSLQLVMIEWKLCSAAHHRLSAWMAR